MLITVLSFVMILTVYGRMFKLYMYTAIAPIPLATFAGGTNPVCKGKNFIRSYAGVCLKVPSSHWPASSFRCLRVRRPSGDTSLSAVTIVWNYIGELVFNLLVLVRGSEGI